MQNKTACQALALTTSARQIAGHSKTAVTNY